MAKPAKGDPVDEKRLREALRQLLTIAASRALRSSEPLISEDGGTWSEAVANPETLAEEEALLAKVVAQIEKHDANLPIGRVGKKAIVRRYDVHRAILAERIALVLKRKLPVKRRGAEVDRILAEAGLVLSLEHRRALMAKTSPGSGSPTDAALAIVEWLSSVLGEPRGRSAIAAAQQAMRTDPLLKHARGSIARGRDLDQYVKRLISD